MQSQSSFDSLVPQRGGLKVVTRPADSGVMEQAAAPVLSLTCPSCRGSFPSALRVGPKTFDAMALDVMVERCSSCGWASQYERRDYYFRPAS